MDRLALVTNYFIETANDLNDQMSNLRLNKLLYFAQGWSLASTGKPLFDSDFEAWTYGPVVPEVYEKYKGKRSIHTSVRTDLSCFSEEEYDVLIAVQNYYGNFVTSKLVDISHRPGSPWDMVRESNKKHIIRKEDMKEYFQKTDGDIMDSILDFMGNLDVVEPERDAEGTAVVTSEGNDGWEI